MKRVCLQKSRHTLFSFNCFLYEKDTNYNFIIRFANCPILFILFLLLF